MQPRPFDLVLSPNQQKQFKPSLYQQVIFDEVVRGNSNLIVSATAGSGKTSTLIEASKLVSGNCLFLAHNRHIVQELKNKLPGHFQCKTTHGLGYQMFKQKGIKFKDPNTSKYDIRCQAVAEDILLGNQSQLDGLNKFTLSHEIETLVRFCQLTLTNPANYKEVEAMINDFSLDIQFAPLSIPRIKNIILWGNSECLKGNLDYNDMLYFPLMWNCEFPKYDNVFADEAQDFNTAQVEILIRTKSVTGIITAVGDRMQSIYKFCGANVNSMDIIKQCLNAKELPLSICYRCPKSHIDLAKKLVPTIEAAPNAIEGEVHYISNDKVNEIVQTGDLILCRTIAPLISKCLQLIGAKINAKVKGRNISKQLTNICLEVSKLAGFSYEDFPAYLEIWSTTKLSRLVSSKASDEVIQSYLDRIQGLKTCYESFVDCESVKELNKEIESLFSDNKTDVWLSSIHQAKGLEADTIIVLNFNKMPLRWKDQSDDDLQQEYNLKFISLTRSKNKLVLCNG